MRSDQSDQLAVLVFEAREIAEDTHAGFATLTPQQLNWKPSADQWSIAQCFDHLMTANGAYFPIFEKVLSGEKENTFWESLPWLPAFWGNLLIKSLDPESTRKLKAPKIFHPSSSTVDGAIIRRFIDQQNQVIRYMKATENLDLDKIKISSPVTNLITYSLMDAYRIIVVHEKRHFLQAVRVSEMNGFLKVSAEV
ncbi:MAG TPA: DinB family protein [Blastocatellia bacterium]|nr:DinB family protein [Blastocatellia bacterium]